MHEDRAEKATQKPPKTKEAMGAAVAEHMHLVHRIVAHFVRRLPRSVQREDLVAAGTLGLFFALRASEHSCPEMFAAYARIRIRGAIIDELRRHDWSPRRRKIANANADANANASASASASANANNVIAIAPIPRPAIHVVGFDDLPIGAAIEAESDAYSDARARSPADEAESRCSAAALRRAVALLPEREQAIIKMRYFEGMASKAIAEALGLSEARISQLHARATARLRDLLEEAEELDMAA